MIPPSTSIIRLLLAFSCIALPFSNAQTQTIPDPNNPAESIVQVATTDINGLPVTNIVATLRPGQLTSATTAATPNPSLTTASTPNPSLTTASTSISTTASLVTSPTIQGPVAQPAPTVAVGAGVTAYQYTTVDANGLTTVIHDIFTPTYNTPSPPSSPTAGTVLGLSAWSALIGTHTAGGPTNAGESWRITPIGAGRLLALAGGVVAGAFAVF